MILFLLGNNKKSVFAIRFIVLQISYSVFSIFVLDQIDLITKGVKILKAYFRRVSLVKAVL
ncbi:hypothetical protein UA41_03420 [Photobacterium kishitanii]|nr:hypothetical protein UA40_05930 [Photobacterium kishitanii]KJG70880.1 hypothetical protein UA41_03420 [Photobacterium kishitanii]